MEKPEPERDMWTYTDARGGRWDVVLGRESWGTLYALFVPRGEAGERSVRQTVLRAASHEEAQRELDALGPGGLARLFERSSPKEGGA